MTHIIGKPPAPKGGATFGDVKLDHLFCLPGHGVYVKVEVFDKGFGPRNARRVGSALTADIRDDEPVELLTQPQPRDPEPDPAVCTSDGLTKGQWYEGVDGTLTLRGDVIDLDVNGESDDHLPPGDPATFRHVAASVVVHGELGHNEAGIGVSPSYGDLHNVSLGHGNRRLHREELEELVRRAVAYLAWLSAQEPASPESGEPHPMAGTELTAHDSEPSEGFHLMWERVKRNHVDRSSSQPEPAEDRSKPAPGWEWGSDPSGYKIGRTNAEEWTSDVFLTLAHYWAWCDAIRSHDEDAAAQLRAIWVDGPDSEAARAARGESESNRQWLRGFAAGSEAGSNESDDAWLSAPLTAGEQHMVARVKPGEGLPMPDPDHVAQKVGRLLRHRDEEAGYR